MKKRVFLFVLVFSKYIFSTEIVTLPITVSGRVISLEEKVVTIVEEDLKEIRLTNSFLKDLFIYGKADAKPFLYKIKSGRTKTFRINAKVINELHYIVDGKKHKLEKYSDIKK
ncbi:hypothetical protein [Cetobacterium sp.]|uniref:hypothetical protein n=1 Tax=Cetobacterium sp. TaxID=2071632 RepID=UPI003F3202A6